ncbi:hypothetical protein EMIT0P218_410014 [Pseudomonas sp. IT-P218]
MAIKKPAIWRAGFKSNISEQENRCQPQEDKEAATVGHGGNHHTGAHGRIPSESRQRHRDQDPHQSCKQQIEGHGSGHHDTERPAPIQQVGDHTDHPTPNHAIDQGYRQLLAHQPRSITRAHLIQRHGPDDHGDGLVAGVTADTRNDRHQCGQRHQLLDGAFEQANHPGSNECSDQVHRQPGPAVTQGLPDRRKNIFFFPQTRHVENFAFALFTNQVDHFIDGQTADQLAVLVDDGRRDQVVTLKRLGSIVGFFIRMETHRIAGHDFRNLLVRIIDQQALDRQHPLEHTVVVNHEQFVGMAWQLLEASQIAQNHFEADILADGNHLEVHQCADLVLVIGQRRAHSLALLSIEGFHQLVDDIPRQLGSQVSQFVGIHILGRGQELVIVHVGDQGFTNRIGYFEQDVAVAISLDQLPKRQAVIQRQGFENIGDVGGVQVIELALQLDQILPVNQVFDAILIRTFLAMSQVFNHSLTLQQLNDLSQAVLQAFLRFLYFNFRHRRTPLPAAGRAGRINQSIHDWKNGVLSNYWVSPWK